jgi:hypothetical protein
VSTEVGPIKSLENKIVTTADKIIFCNDALRKQTVDRHHLDTSGINASTVPHSFDESSFSGGVEVDNGNVLRHVGSLYGARRVEFLLEALEELHEVLGGGFSVELVGSEMLGQRSIASRKTLKRARPWCTEVPQVSKVESVHLMKSAPLLISLDSANGPSVFLPSKLIEYVASRRPVIVYSPPGSPSWEIGIEFGFYLADIRNREEIMKVTKEALLNYRQWRPNDKAIMKFSSHHIAKKWLGELEA